MDKVDFCSCTDTKCSLHPSNHNNGCTPCIKKNLKCNEIPSCFFRKLVDDFTPDMDFTFECFANLVKNKSPLN